MPASSVVMVFLLSTIHRAIALLGIEASRKIHPLPSEIADPGRERTVIPLSLLANLLELQHTSFGGGEEIFGKGRQVYRTVLNAHGLVSP